MVSTLLLSQHRRTKIIKFTAIRPQEKTQMQHETITTSRMAADNRKHIQQLMKDMTIKIEDISPSKSKRLYNTLTTIKDIT